MLISLLILVCGACLLYYSILPSLIEFQKKILFFNIIIPLYIELKICKRIPILWESEYNTKEKRATHIAYSYPASSDKVKKLILDHAEPWASYQYKDLLLTHDLEKVLCRPCCTKSLGKGWCFCGGYIRYNNITNFCIENNITYHFRCKKCNALFFEISMKNHSFIVPINDETLSCDEQIIRNIIE